MIAADKKLIEPIKMFWGLVKWEGSGTTIVARSTTIKEIFSEEA